MCPISGDKPFRFARDMVTSAGCLTGIMILVCMPALLNESVQNFRNLQTLGSLKTKSDWFGNSSFIVCTASLRNVEASGESNQSGLKGRQSHHIEPAEANMRSFNSIMRADSQKPVGLSSAVAMREVGGLHPIVTSAPATDDVPLRCMPATTMAVLGELEELGMVM